MDTQLFIYLRRIIVLHKRHFLFVNSKTLQFYSTKYQNISIIGIGTLHNTLIHYYIYIKAIVS